MTIKSNFSFLSLAAALAMAVPANAQDFDAGWAALQAGDYETALGHLEPLALAGDDRAMVGMGYLYLNGFGVTENYSIAFRIFRDAADLENTDAIYAIANGYYFGEWLEQDFKQAHEWYRRVEAMLEDPASVAVSGRSPAEILATQLREALASNTMGARVDPAEKRRADGDQVKRWQSERRALGVVPGAEGRQLSDRFSVACDRFFQQQPSPTATRAPRPRSDGPSRVNRSRPRPQPDRHDRA